MTLWDILERTSPGRSVGAAVQCEVFGSQAGDRSTTTREDLPWEYPTDLVGFTLSMMSTPSPIDPRGPRFNQSVLTLALVIAFLVQVWAVVPVFAVVLLLGAAFGPKYGPFLRLYAEAIKPRLSPPAELEDPRPPRFAAAIGVAFLGAATLAFVVGQPAVGWALSLIVAALAALAATSGICVGCEIYLWLARRRGVELAA